MNVEIQTIIAVYDEKLGELAKENVLLKAQLRQIQQEQKKQEKPAPNENDEEKPD